MVYLNEIEIYDEAVEISPYKKISGSVTHLFMRLIKRKLVTNNVRILNVSIEDNAEKHLTYDITGGFAWVWYDISKIAIQMPATDFEKKKITLDTIYEVLCHLSEKEKWDINVVMDAYNKCLESELKNEWWFKDKLFASPGKHYYAGLYHIYDTGKYDIYIVLFDNKKKELVRHLIYKTDFEVFLIEKISWQSKDTICYKFIGPEKQFVYTVEQLLNSEVKEIPEKIHLLFK